VICNLLEANVDAASRADNFGCLPLHIVAQNGQVWDVQVQTLYDAFPTSVRARSGVKLGNSLPLHLAAENPEAEFSLISRLVELHPRGASQSNRQGKLPLHLACESGLSWKAVSSIHEAFTAAIEQPEQNSRGWTALHITAACHKADKELLSNLVQLYPQSATLADTRGRYPLHLACLAGKSWQNGLSMLFKANPDALRCPDNIGLLPFHIASFRLSAGAPSTEKPKPIEPKGRRFSRSVSVRSEALEVEQAIAKDAENTRKLEVLFHLLKADPTVLY
jgi:ankyrin repeat protein